MIVIQENSDCLCNQATQAGFMRMSYHKVSEHSGGYINIVMSGPGK